MRTLLLNGLLAASLLVSGGLAAQSTTEDDLGAWYMYFYSHQFGDGPWGFQGDAQFRFFDFGSDLEQILIRQGLTYTPEGSDIKFTLGYASITTGTLGESSDRVHENRIYQEALFPSRFGRFHLAHRFRVEQRFNEGQDFRSRFRYNIFVNVALNKQDMGNGTLYLALYNEIFINGNLNIGDGRSVERFDRNRIYTGLGYGLRDNLRVQLGWMLQTSVNREKGQAQFSAHHSF